MRFCQFFQLLFYVVFTFAQSLYTATSVHTAISETTPAAAATVLRPRNVAQWSQNLSKSISPMKPRILSDWKLTGIVIVSDIDGNLHGLDRKTGTALWTLPIGEPLVQISGNDSNEDANLLWFVEPYEDGSLFYFSPEFGLNKLPTTIKNLVMESPFSLAGDDKIYTGTRRTSLFTLNKNTGEVKKQFGHSSDQDTCVTSDEFSGLSQGTHDDSDHIMMGKTTYELSIHSKADSSVVWNVTYSHWGPNNIDNDLMMQNGHSLDKLYFTPFHDKSLLCLSHASGAPAWMSRLSSLVVNVFDVFTHNNHGDSVAIPHPTKEFNALQHVADGSETNKFDLCFLNKTARGSQWFAMSYTNFPSLIKSSPLSPYQLALQKYEQGSLDQPIIEQIRDLRVHGKDAEFFLTGIHKFGSLDASNFYQSVIRFDQDSRRQIDSTRDLIQANPWLVKDSIGQNPMDGIYFPLNEETVKTELSIVQRHKDIKPLQKFERNVLPVALHKQKSPLDVNIVQSVSLFRRIGEDLIVMSTLILFLLAVVKIAQKFRYLNSTHEKIFGPAKEEVSITSHEKIFHSAKEEGSDQVNTSPSLRENPIMPTPDSVQIILPKSSEKNKKISDPSPLDLDFEEPVVLKSPLTDDDDDDDDDNVADPKTSTMRIEDTVEGPEPDLTVPTKKKRKRGSRGGKRGGKSKKYVPSDDEASLSLTPSETPSETIMVDEAFEQVSNENAIPTISLVKTFAKPDNELKRLQIDNNLVISNKVLGYGSHGTVVYEGTFENRPVAVKRMLFDFYDIANHEVRLLQESDDHPNVIRYFCSQSNLKEKFLYIALELCVCSLEDSIGGAQQNARLDTKNRIELLHQLASGLGYLHSLKIVHRDLKPQNILLGENTKKSQSSGKSSIRLLISDFGLCKKLDADQSSFGATTHNAASGTTGWRAPELLRPNSYSARMSILSEEEDSMSISPFGSETRLTKAIDIFSLGCVFFYILSDGFHPFGDRYLREANIIKGHSDLDVLRVCCPADYVEATDLIASMIASDPKSRPNTQAILAHPFFWATNKKLEFLLKVSDRFEVERRDPPSNLLLVLEQVSSKVHNGDWFSRFDSDFIDNLGKYRKYQKDKLMDLLRALRNKYHHYNDMPPSLQKQMSPLPSGFYAYFNQKFPHMLMEIYAVVRKHLSNEHVFAEFL